MTGFLAVLLTAGSLGVLLAVALRRRNEPAAVNIVAALLVTLTPAAVEFVLGPAVSFTSLLTYWIGGASVLHCLGMLGRYESVPGWDHLTHGISSALATALLYAGFLSVVGLDAAEAAAATVLTILGMSVLWEVAELVLREVGERRGIDPLLTNYGWRDTALDLLFDVVGAALVLALDVRVFVSVFETLPSG